MILAKTLKPPNTDGEKMTVSRLVELYGRTLEGLEACADVCPANDAEHGSADAKEASLLDVEACLLDKAAHVEIRTEREFLDMLDMWRKSSGIVTGVDVNPSDRIAMNIFRHIMEVGLIKH